MEINYIEINKQSWNHSISEVVNNLLKNNLTIKSLEEFDYSPYNCFQKAVQSGPKQYRIEHLGRMIPMFYTIVAEKNS